MLKPLINAILVEGVEAFQAAEHGRLDRLPVANLYGLHIVTHANCTLLIFILHIFGVGRRFVLIHRKFVELFLGQSSLLIVIIVLFSITNDWHVADQLFFCTLTGVSHARLGPAPLLPHIP